MSGSISIVVVHSALRKPRWFYCIFAIACLLVAAFIAIWVTQSLAVGLAIVAAGPLVIPTLFDQLLDRGIASENKMLHVFDDAVTIGDLALPRASTAATSVVALAGGFAVLQTELGKEISRIMFVEAESDATRIEAALRAPDGPIGPFAFRAARPRNIGSMVVRAFPALVVGYLFYVCGLRVGPYQFLMAFVELIIVPSLLLLAYVVLAFEVATDTVVTIGETGVMVGLREVLFEEQPRLRGSGEAIVLSGRRTLSFRLLAPRDQSDLMREAISTLITMIHGRVLSSVAKTGQLYRGSARL